MILIKGIIIGICIGFGARSLIQIFINKKLIKGLVDIKTEVNRKLTPSEIQNAYDKLVMDRRKGE